MQDLSRDEFTVVDWLLTHQGAPHEIPYPNNPPDWLQTTLSELIRKKLVVSHFHFVCVGTIALTQTAIRSKTQLNIHHLNMAEHAVLNWMLERQHTAPKIPRPVDAPDWFNIPLDSLIAKKLVVPDSELISTRSLAVASHALRAVLARSLDNLATQVTSQPNIPHIMRGTDARAIAHAHD